MLVTPAAQTGTAARPVALFVMGMARSGTSALTRVLSHAAIFPACRAVVHHGGAGTTAAGLRAGAPTLILSWTPEQAIWGAQLKRLEVGSGRRFSTTTEKSLVAELRRILAPQYVTRAREIATRMTKPAESVTTAADLLESFARLRRVR